jgi:serine/threonine protein kinase/Tol biopolymer transport system component
MAHDALGQGSLVGRTLGHYRVVERVGEGGMGVVYRAQDEHLSKREVAIKVLPPVSLTDATARLRFRKEAHALSKLSHPNIATIYDFDSEDGTDFLVEEYIEGMSLSEVLAAGPLALKEIVALGTQLCEGLAAAHEHGILHRDIKPANLRVTPDAQLKILDFGLARSMGAETPSKTATMSETQIVAGTVPYLAPEQLRNEKLDARCDIWATGCVLYEMATGRRPFLGQSTALLEGILHQTPAPPSKVNGKVPGGLDAIILKCLEKDPSLRYGSAREIAVDLRRLALTSSTTLVVSQVPKVRRWPWIAALAVLATIAILLALGYQEVSSAPRIVATRQLTHTRLRKSFGGLATDGSRVYFTEQRTANREVVAQVSCAGGETTDVPAHFKNYIAVRGISPAGSELLVYDCCPRNYWIQPVPAGATRRAPVPSESGRQRWTRTGTFLYTSGDRHELYEVSEDGSQTKRLLKDSLIGLFALSPDGKRIRFDRLQNSTGLISDIMEAGVDGSNEHPVFPEMRGQTGVGDWTADGKLFFFFQRKGAANVLWAVRDPKVSLPFLHPKPTSLYAGPLQLIHVIGSRNASELYAVGASRSGELSVYDSRSAVFVPYLNGISASFVSFSPDRQWIAYVSYPDGSLWKSRVDGSDKTQLTFAPMGVLNPRWSPDGKTIAFSEMFASEHYAIYTVSSEGGQPRLLSTGPVDPGDATWAPDGQSIVYGGSWRAGALSDVEVLDLKTMVSSKVPGSEGLFSPRLSPDGRYIVAIPADNFNRLMLYDTAVKKWRTLLEGGVISWPAWTHDSKALYLYTDRKIVRIDIASGKVNTVADLEGVLWTSFAINWAGWFDLTPDERIMILRDTGTEEVYALELEY